MASEKTCANDPNFAIICSFFQKFSPMLNIQQPDIHLLQEWLENTDEVQPGLKELHVKLLRKMRRTVHETAWETALVKFCYLYSSQDAWEVERFGYKKSSLKVKLRILAAILEFQFQLNGKFRSKFSNLSAEELRSEPIGRDKLGHSYWLTQDPSCNFRIYQEHLDEEIWQVVASNRSEMETLISRLKGNEVVLPSLIGVIDEDSSSNSCPNAVIRLPPPEEQDDSQTSSISTRSKTKVPNLKIKLDSSLNGNLKTKLENVLNGNGHLKNGKSVANENNTDEEDADGEDEDDEEEEEEAEEEDEGEDDEFEEEDEDEVDNHAEENGKKATAASKIPEKTAVEKPIIVENGKKESEENISIDKKINTRRVKPIVISQSKATVSSEERPPTVKKRSLEDDDRDPETERIVKKSRPTLLDNRREKKSKYEKLSEEDDDDDDDDDEEDEEDDDVGEEEEEEGEEEDDEDGEDEEVPNEVDEEDDEVGEEIEEDVLIVKGEGSGKDCEGSFLDQIEIGCEENDEDPAVGEEIEEEIIYVYGEGSGKQCLVGNTNEETGKSSFFFGQPGCLKLSPIKKNVEGGRKTNIESEKCSGDDGGGQKNGEVESKNDKDIPDKGHVKEIDDEKKGEGGGKEDKEKSDHSEKAAIDLENVEEKKKVEVKNVLVQGPKNTEINPKVVLKEPTEAEPNNSIRHGKDEKNIKQTEKKTSEEATENVQIAKQIEAEKNVDDPPKPEEIVASKLPTKKNLKAVEAESKISTAKSENVKILKRKEIMPRTVEKVTEEINLNTEKEPTEAAKAPKQKENVGQTSKKTSEAAKVLKQIKIVPEPTKDITEIVKSPDIEQQSSKKVVETTKNSEVVSKPPKEVHAPDITTKISKEVHAPKHPESTAKTLQEAEIPKQPEVTSKTSSEAQLPKYPEVTLKTSKEAQLPKQSQLTPHTSKDAQFPKQTEIAVKTSNESTALKQTEIGKNASKKASEKSKILEVELKTSQESTEILKAAKEPEEKSKTLKSPKEIVKIPKQAEDQFQRRKLNLPKRTAEKKKGESHAQGEEAKKPEEVSKSASSVSTKFISLLGTHKEEPRKSERKSEKAETRAVSQERLLKCAALEQETDTQMPTGKLSAAEKATNPKLEEKVSAMKQLSETTPLTIKSPEKIDKVPADDKSIEKLAVVPSEKPAKELKKSSDPCASDQIEESHPPAKKIMKKNTKKPAEVAPLPKPQDKVEQAKKEDEQAKKDDERAKKEGEQVKKQVEIAKKELKTAKTSVDLPKKATDIKPIPSKPEEVEEIQSKTVEETRSSNTRKRRLSEEKVRSISESDSDLNSDSVAPPTDEDEDVGGKRPKMRFKAMNIELRKKVEDSRKSGENHESTSEEESSKPIEPTKPEEKMEAKAAPIPEQAQVTLQTRATRRNPAGTPMKISPPKSRARKKPNAPVKPVVETKQPNAPVKPVVETKQPSPPPVETKPLAEIPSLKPELPVEEDSKTVVETPEEMPKLEPEANGPKKVTPQKATRSRKREIDTSNIIDPDSETPVRQSRRIAQLKIREEAERRKLEEVALKKMKAELKKKKKEEHKSVCQEYVVPSEPSEEEDTEVDSEAEMNNKKIVSKKKLAKTKGKEGRWSSGPEDEPEEDDEYDLPHERYDTDPGSPLFRSDHEFSPESEIEDESQAVPLKRARTARKEGAEIDPAENLDESCHKCGKKDHPEWILLCDKCDKGYHCSCLSPVLFIIPEGDWFCPPCQQDQLIAALGQQMLDLDNLVEQKRIKEEEDTRAKNVALAQKLKDDEEEAKEKEVVRAKKSREERVKKRRKPRVRKAFVIEDEEASTDSTDNAHSSRSSSGRSSSSGSGSGSSSGSGSDGEPIYKLRKRRQVNVSYRFNEYDDLINSAIKEEMDEVAGAGNLGRGKDISTIIEADKEEKMRQKNTIQESDEEVVKPVVKEEAEVVKEEVVEEKPAEVKAENDSGSDFEPTKRKSKMTAKNLKKKSRKLNNLDISSDDDGSDEDFKTSSYETEEDESISAQTESDSSLEVYRRRGKKNKKGKRPSRRAARERRRLDADFIVEDSEFSDDAPRKKKPKRKYDWELRDSGTEEELSEQIDSEDLCDDSTDSDSDGAWRPSKRKKTKKNAVKQKPMHPSHGKQPKIRKKEIIESDEQSPSPDPKPTKPISKGKHETDESDDEDVPRTRGKRFTYLEDFEDDSSDDGIKPGVKRPDTPPEERAKFIKKQEEIKRMLAEKNTEAAKAAATPTLTPLSKGAGPTADSLSTVPLSVIKGAKVLDMDYLQRKGELNSDDADTDFDEDLPDDFDPEDMDEEEIAKMMEEEDFAQQQLKLAGEAIRQKKIKEMEQLQRPPVEMPLHIQSRQQQHSTLQTQEPPRKRLPMPTILPHFSNTPRFLPPHHHRLAYDQQMRQSVAHQQQSIPLSVQSLQSRPFGTAAGSSANAQPPSSAMSQESANEPVKPRGRRKKITPLRDTLQKQQAAAAAAAAAASIGPGPPPPTTAKEIPPVSDKPAAGSKLSVAQPPQLYTPPTSTPPSVITRLPQPPRPRFTEQSSRFYPPANQLAHRPSLIRHGGPPMPPHHTLRPSFASGPPPLRPANPRLPISIGNGISRQPTPRQIAPFADQYGTRSPHPAPPQHAYRPPLYGSPGFPPAPPQQSPTPIHPAASDYSGPSYGPTPPYGPYYPPPQQPIVGPTHSTPPPPAAAAVPVSIPPTSVIAPPSPSLSAPASRTQSSPVTVSVAAPEPVVVIPPAPIRPKATPLETFDSKSTPPLLLETGVTNSPYTRAVQPDDNDDDDGDEDNSAVCPPINTTSEFSGLVSYFSSQHDDLNT